MALIPAGSFLMGDSFNEGGTDEVPVHTVYVSAFYMDKYPVTRALWFEVYQWAIANGYNFSRDGAGKSANHPAHSMNWFDAVKWCNARSEMEGRTPAYYTNTVKSSVYRSGQVWLQNSFVKWNVGYRLPTEAEWEKAARGGLGGRRFPWGDTISRAEANYYSDWISGMFPRFHYDLATTSGYHPTYATGGTPYTSPVGSFIPNGYGLYDMAGNVSEWCWDWYTSVQYGSGPATDPHGPVSGQNRVKRGGSVGSLNNYAYDCRAAARDQHWPGWDGTALADYLGFRCVLPPGQ
jgi:formylglycine-generating enzyme required for sulfatase activity